MNNLLFKKKHSLEVTEIGGFDEYAKFSSSMVHEYEKRKNTELSLVLNESSFSTKGFCYVCGGRTRFVTDFLYSDPNDRRESIRIPNWRERLVCPRCNLNNRIRASIQFLEEKLGAHSENTIYLTEQTTPLYSYLADKYPRICGSEYLGERIPFGKSDADTGIRNESITKLTFPDGSFDFILSFDVFEHVPEYQAAFAECARCLRKGGGLLFTVPFNQFSKTNLVRARVDKNGKIEHIMEPEYHGDPIKQEGCLCFYHFGWELLGQVRQIGFSEVQAHVFWSRKLGYLGIEQMLFTARR